MHAHESHEVSVYEEIGDQRHAAFAKQALARICPCKRAITADTDLRLCRYRSERRVVAAGQVAYDTAIAKEALHKELATIQRCSLLAV